MKLYSMASRQQATDPAPESSLREAQNARLLLLGALALLILALAPALLDEDLIAMPLLALPTMILILVAALWRGDNNIWARGVLPVLAAFLPAILALAQLISGEYVAALVYLLLTIVPVILSRRKEATRERDLRLTALFDAGLALCCVLISTQSFNYPASWLAITALELSVGLVLAALLLRRSWARNLHWVAVGALALTAILGLLGSRFAVLLPGGVDATKRLFGAPNSLGFLVVLLVTVALIELSALWRSGVARWAGWLAVALLFALTLFTLANGDFYGWPYLAAIELVVLLIASSFSLIAGSD